MIFVDRSAVPVPEALTSDKAKAERERILNLLQLSSDRHLAQLRVTFDSSIWESARQNLISLFHGKCAFCDSSMIPEFGEVHHFRPIAGITPAASDRAHLYYAWLAYEWENLVVVCRACSVSSGKPRFPIEGPPARFLADVRECRETENAFLLDPTFDNPALHLAFDTHAGICRPLTARGAATIRTLNLNRESLLDSRRRVADLSRLLATQYFATFATADEYEKERTRRRLVTLWAPEQEHAAVVITVVKEAFNRVLLNIGAEPLKDPNLDGIIQRITAMTPSVAPPAELAVPAATPERTQYPNRHPVPPFAHDRIRRIEITNFKAIQHLAFDITDPAESTDGVTGALMLLGENATGKSTVLEAVALTLLGTRQVAKLGLNAEDFIRRKNWHEPSTKNEAAEVKIIFDGSDKPVTLTIDPRKKRFAGNALPATVLLAYGPRRFFSDQRAARHSTQPHARVKTLFDPLAIIANPNRWLVTCEDSLFNPSIRALRPILMLPDNAFVDRPADRKTSDEMLFEVHGVTAPLKRLSEGYKTVVATSVDIMREMLRYWPDLESARGVVLIDEIETHLHPRWKMRIVQRMRRAMPNVQFIATTHDPLCLRGLYDGEVQVLARDEEHGIERVRDVPNVRGLSVEQLLTSDYFGLYSTEDPEIEDEVMRYVVLATKRERSRDDDEELQRQRERAKERLLLGSKPQTQMLFDAATDYLLDQRVKSPNERAPLRRKSVEKLIDLWRSFEPEDAAE